MVSPEHVGQQFPDEIASHEASLGDHVHVTVSDPFGLSSTMLSGRVVRNDKARLHIEQQGGEDDGGVNSFLHEHIRSVLREPRG